MSTTTDDDSLSEPHKRTLCRPTRHREIIQILDHDDYERMDVRRLAGEIVYTESLCHGRDKQRSQVARQLREKHLPALASANVVTLQNGAGQPETMVVETTPRTGTLATYIMEQSTDWGCDDAE